MNQEQKSIQLTIASALKTLMLNHPYQKVSVKMICEEAYITRQTFYNHFFGKEYLLGWIIRQDYAAAVLPMLKNKIGVTSIDMHFRYIYEEKVFYSEVYRIDGGRLLHDFLIRAYCASDSTVLEITEHNKSKEKKIDPDLFFLYFHSGIASIVVHWIKTDYATPIEEISRDTTILLTNTHQQVRLHYLV